MKCYKCEGKGHIEGFLHVANGRCFQCNGTGVLPEAKKKNVGYSRVFIDQYRVKQGFCYSLDELKDKGFTMVKWTSNAEHPTAKQGLFINESDYLLGQPICQSSMWYIIPKDVFQEFLMHYNKVWKTELI